MDRFPRISTRQAPGVEACSVMSELSPFSLAAVLYPWTQFPNSMNKSGIRGLMRVRAPHFPVKINSSRAVQIAKEVVQGRSTKGKASQNEMLLWTYHRTR